MKKKAEVIEILNQGGYIMVDSIYRTAHVYDANGENGDTCRYDVAERLEHAEGYKKRYSRGWCMAWYIEKEKTEEEKDAEIMAAALDAVDDAMKAFENAGVISNVKIERLTAEETAAIVAEAREEEARQEAEKTAAEWQQESDNVQAATLAALAPVIAAEEAAPAVEEEAPEETAQEKTDRENREHCQRIAEDVEAYAGGRVYKCPECGEEIEFPDGVGDKFKCTCCGEVNSVDGWEQLSLYDYFSDCLDIEYRCDSKREYRSVCIMVACGGPNIYIDTSSKAVELYWWTDRAEYPLSYSAVDAVNEWAEEYWNCYQ